MTRILNYIDGRLIDSESGNHLDNIEPATGRVYSTLPDSSEADVETAVAAALQAHAAWSRTPAAVRSRSLLRLAELIDRDADALARAESIDQGKPVSLARAVDIPRAAANFRFFATAILHAEERAFHTDSPAVGTGAALNYTLRKPRGVAGCISPWNLPLYLLTWKIAPALAAGCAVVAKPSELTPMTAFLLSRLCIEAELPPGVLNIVHGTGPGAGAAIVRHPDVPSISFTGGTKTGEWIAREAAPLFKRLSLELGGKNPFLIFADADLDAAADAALRAAFTNQGEICLCGSRVLVERAAFDHVLDRLVSGAKQLRIGDPLEESTQQGALVSRDHRDKVASYVRLARDLGGTIHCGGDRAGVSGRCAGGFFFQPTVISGLDPRCRVEQEEIFGPVVTLTPFDSDEEAVALANGTPYGLAATLWTRDASRAHRLAVEIDAGILWVNCWMLRDLRTPFGGMKQSGIGREGGLDALRFFTEEKNVCIALDPKGTA